MANPVERSTLIRWLKAHGFEEVGGRATSLGKFKLPGHRRAVTVPSHGDKDISRPHLGSILRGLEQMGFDRVKTRAELESGHW